MVSYNEYKNHISSYTWRFFLFYMKNALVRKNKEVHAQSVFEVRHALMKSSMKSVYNYESITKTIAKALRKQLRKHYVTESIS